MKILYYFEQLNTPMFLWQNDHIVNELKQHSIDVEIFNPLHYETIEEANKKLITCVTKGHYDLFMTCHAENLLFIETIKNIKRLGIPTLLICFDNLLIPYEHKNVCKYYDLVWLTSHENQELFIKWGARTIFLPYAANPFFYQYRQHKEVESVCFIGTPYGSRANIINTLIHAGISVSLYGKQVTSEKIKHGATKGYLYTIATDLKFPIGRKLLFAAAKQRISKQAVLDVKAPFVHYKGFAECMSDVYSTYAIALATTTARNTGILKAPVPVVNLRSFEIPMSGGIQFCQYNEELSHYFKNEKEIVFYQNDEEMIEKARFYLTPKAEKLRCEIRKNARLRAENEHTWMCRFSEIFKELKIK